MQFLTDATTMKIQQLKSRHMAYKVDDGYFNNAAIISLQVKRHCRYEANKSYLLSQSASLIMWQLRRTHSIMQWELSHINGTYTRNILTTVKSNLSSTQRQHLSTSLLNKDWIIKMIMFLRCTWLHRFEFIAPSWVYCRFSRHCKYLRNSNCNLWGCSQY